VRRIAVIGNGGGGKSTLCRTLGARLGIPVHEVDPVQFRPDWSRAPVAEVERVLDGWLVDDTWIIDGFGPWPAIERRLAAADTIVWVDFRLRTHLWWTAKRQLFWRKTADGRRCPPARQMFATILHVHRRYRSTIEKGLAAHAAKVVRLRSPRQLRRFARDAS
jgi:adenylate kinase family enzyme